MSGKDVSEGEALIGAAILFAQLEEFLSDVELNRMMKERPKLYAMFLSMVEEGKRLTGK